VEDVVVGVGVWGWGEEGLAACLFLLLKAGDDALS